MTFFKDIAMNWDNINVQFGNILRLMRKSRHLSQEEFAELCDISRAYYGRIERGEHSVTLDLCQKISDAIGISISDLFKDLP